MRRLLYNCIKRCGSGLTWLGTALQLQNFASADMFLRPLVFIALISFAAGGASPISNFMGNWTGSCVQTVGMKDTCADAAACQTSGITNMRMSPGWDFTTGVSSCTQL